VLVAVEARRLAACGETKEGDGLWAGHTKRIPDEGSETQTGGRTWGAIFPLLDVSGVEHLCAARHGQSGGEVGGLEWVRDGHVVGHACVSFKGENVRWALVAVGEEERDFEAGSHEARSRGAVDQVGDAVVADAEVAASAADEGVVAVGVRPRTTFRAPVGAVGDGEAEPEFGEDQELCRAEGKTEANRRNDVEPPPRARLGNTEETTAVHGFGFGSGDENS
jgi:hypothetical protein